MVLVGCFLSCLRLCVSYINLLKGHDRIKLTGLQYGVKWLKKKMEEFGSLTISYQYHSGQIKYGSTFNVCQKGDL